MRNFATKIFRLEYREFLFSFMVQSPIQICANLWPTKANFFLVLLRYYHCSFYILLSRRKKNGKELDKLVKEMRGKDMRISKTFKVMNSVSFKYFIYLFISALFVGWNYAWTMRQFCWKFIHTVTWEEQKEKEKNTNKQNEMDEAK